MDKNLAHDQAEVRKKTPIRAHVVYEAVRAEGERELARPGPELRWSALAAGMSMSFSFIMETLLAARLPDAEWALLISKFGYSAGFLIVILGRQQLFTEHTLTAVLPFLSHVSKYMFFRVARLWSILFLFNLLGTLLAAAFIAAPSVFAPEMHEQFTHIGHETLRFSFLPMLLKAVFAGWLIALMVWLLPFAETARFFVILFVTYIVGIGEFPHIVAGSVEVFYLTIRGLIGWTDALFGFIVPVALGNAIGGVTLVALVNHEQVATDLDGDR